MSYICEFCGSERKDMDRVHRGRCAKNPNALPIQPKSEVWVTAMRNRRGSAKNQYSGDEDGGNKHVISEATRIKMSAAAKKQVWTEERKRRHSQRMSVVVAENPESYSTKNVSGRVKNYNHDGKVLKGSWEVKVAVWLDGLGILWGNDVTPSPYWWNDTWHLYFPDFKIEGADVHIEVKGYLRDRDIAKWDQFTGKLIIVDKRVINSLQNYTFGDIMAKCLYVRK